MAARAASPPNRARPPLNTVSAPNSRASTASTRRVLWVFMGPPVWVGVSRASAFERPAFSGFFNGLAVADVVNPLEGGDDFFVVRDDDDGGVGLAGHLVQDAHDAQRA